MARRVLGILVILIVAAAVPVGTVSAHDYRSKTKAVIEEGGPSGASGHITAAVEACLKNRKITLFREQDGDDQSYGSDLTNRAGKWDIESSLLAGMYYVKVKPREVGDASDDHDHECLRTRSISYRF